MGTDPTTGSDPHGALRASWRRSLQRLREPSRAAATLAFDDGDLVLYREEHALAAAMPTLRRLLVEPCATADLIVAVGDERARLLWVEGSDDTRRRAERVALVPGADWSEHSVGTSAPGTALHLGRGIQVSREQHFNPDVRRWSCTAVPLRDPESGTLLGVVDVSGRGDAAVAPHALALVSAAVAAAEAELVVQRLRATATGATSAVPPRSEPLALRAEAGRTGVEVAAHLQVLGRDTALLLTGDRRLELSLRHSELLLVLARHPDGLRTGDLAGLVCPDAPEVTLRAEITRLRKVIEGFDPRLVPLSRPYRLPVPVTVDVDLVLDHLARGWHRAALSAYAGPVLPGSEAPGVQRLRERLSASIRDAVLGAGSPDSMLGFLELPEAHTDADAWLATLRRLPARSPKRVRIIEHLEWLDRELR